MTITILNYLEALPDILHDKFLEILKREAKQNFSRLILYEIILCFMSRWADEKPNSILPTTQRTHKSLLERF